jgi:predicted aldo/keto reductase-like oxidoreductase
VIKGLSNLIYRKFKNLDLSTLGFGAMRLPVIDGDDGNIDVAVTSEMVAYAMKHGVNYYDTAWGYHNGQSEIVMGKILRQYHRDRY